MSDFIGAVMVVILVPYLVRGCYRLSTRLIFDRAKPIVVKPTWYDHAGKLIAFRGDVAALVAGSGVPSWFVRPIVRRGRHAAEIYQAMAELEASGASESVQHDEAAGLVEHWWRAANRP